MKKKSLKIGIFCPYNLAMPGGVQQHVFEQAKELRRRGYEVKIVTPKPRGELLIDDRDVVFVGTSARFRTPQHTSVDGSISVSNEEIETMVANEQFDVMHMHEPLVPLVARQMLPRIPCPVLGTFHAAMPETMLAKSIAGSISPFVRGVLKHLDAFTAVSPAATSYISNYVDTSDVYLVPNGVNLVNYHKAGKTDKARKHILYVGRLEKRKGTRFLIEAFAFLHESMPDVRLTIAGDGPDRQKLEQYADELGVSPFIDFLGYVDDAAKQKLMREAALFVSPALYGESFGIVLIEAMASGTPVIGGYNPGYAFVLQGRGAFGLVDPEESELFASRMEIFLTDTKFRKLWQEWALNEVKKYSYKSIVDSYEKIYKDLAAKGKQQVAKQ
jgi:phosphatidylinositol alpha-mannosyltransferase